MLTITDLIEKEYGSRKWVLARRSAGRVARYGSDAIFLTRKQYARLDKMTDIANAETHKACQALEKWLGNHCDAVNTIRMLIDAGFRVEYSPNYYG